MQAIAVFTEKGRWNMAAGHQKTVAELYETELNDLAKALEAYEIAADWYAGEDSPA
jgi:alpha-soluble NSF attachment protein